LTIPEELDYIVTECAIARYNRIGSEGMDSESMDGHSASYVDKDLSDYEDEILDYLGDDADGSKKGDIKFLGEPTNLLRSSRSGEKNTMTTQEKTWSRRRL